jgi:hypothetical protein
MHRPPQRSSTRRFFLCIDLFETRRSPHERQRGRNVLGNHSAEARFEPPVHQKTLFVGINRSILSKHVGGADQNPLIKKNRQGSFFPKRAGCAHFDFQNDSKGGKLRSVFPKTGISAFLVGIKRAGESAENKRISPSRSFPRPEHIVV